MKKVTLVAALLVTSTVNSAEIPDFLDANDIENAEFKCLTEPATYSEQDQKYVDMLWDETLQYLQGYAIALTNDAESGCINSDKTVYETAGGVKKMCIMDRRDMKLMVKNIYQVVNNPEQAKQCFSAREDVDWIYSPGGKLEKKSPVAKWLSRETFKSFFKNKVTDKKVKKYGKKFTKNFYDMITGPDMKMPASFPYDISANALPNLWAAVGWFPMYAQDSERNKRNFYNIRGGYAYAEVFGHWGLLRIDEINGEKVGAEVGMVAQSVDTFYPYHNHAISEIYYTMRDPACVNQFKNFAIREDNELVKTVREDAHQRVVEFYTGEAGEYNMWSSTSPSEDPLIYFHQNTIHAFDIDGQCEAKPHKKAMVTVWARSNAHDKRNDYGTTLLCESQNQPNTPAKLGEVIECDLTKTKW
ncbi:hypothetical protein [Shewanella gelidii]|uniref:Uncharacterized protein n=1 Tax=Shewanella gelidii TaxID=1642821 RepID=A0A917JUQ3_9GAMM|nr:hypothetical protein [Shewanella gelidii]MCL1098479.1 hypothetical protein [Shewanella gelidii]GGI82435.1 hypothetical protein GCM10009332_19570 [Shewanella gelidii]